MKKYLHYLAEVTVYGLFLFIVCFAFFRCQEARSAEFYRFQQNGTLHFVDSPKLIPKAATNVQKVEPTGQFTHVERPHVGREISVAEGAVVGATTETGRHVPSDTTEDGPFTCVRERRQVGALNLPVYVTRDPSGREVNETPSVWGCPQTSINR